MHAARAAQGRGPPLAGRRQLELHAAPDRLGHAERAAEPLHLQRVLRRPPLGQPRLERVCRLQLWLLDVRRRSGGGSWSRQSEVRTQGVVDARGRGRAKGRRRRLGVGGGGRYAERLRALAVSANVRREAEGSKAAGRTMMAAKGCGWVVERVAG